MLKKIILEIDGKEQTFDYEEAKRLYEALRIVYDKNSMPAYTFSTGTLTA